jgi:two-component system chemotaxis response regulator CheY
MLNFDKGKFYESKRRKATGLKQIFVTVAGLQKLRIDKISIPFLICLIINGKVFYMFKTVLIADDSRFIRNLIKNILYKQGFQVIFEASDGSIAVALYKKELPDIVLLDLTMPNINGLDALRNIIKFDPKAKVIICSAMGQKRLIIDAIKFGAKDFIVKPNFNALVPAIEKLFN